MGKTKVCIIGAGAAGMSAAWSLSRYPDKFDVTVCEKQAQAGGVATTENIEVMPGIFCDINDGVQGGSSSYRNSILLHREVGFEPTPVHMRVSFGQDTHAWTNHLPSNTNGIEIQQLKSEIRRFGFYLKLISWFRTNFYIYTYMVNNSSFLSFKKVYKYNALSFKQLYFLVQVIKHPM